MDNQEKVSSPESVQPVSSDSSAQSTQTVQSARPVQQTIIVRQESRKSNGIGVAGFVLSLVGIVFCWIPVLNWVLWFLGFLFSFIGIFKAPRGLAVAGLCISFAGIFLLIVVLGSMIALLG